MCCQRLTYCMVILASYFFLCYFCDTMSLSKMALFVYSLQDASHNNWHCINGFFMALFLLCKSARSTQYKVKYYGLLCRSVLHTTYLHPTHRQPTSLTVRLFPYQRENSNCPPTSQWHCVSILALLWLLGSLASCSKGPSTKPLEVS